MLTLVLNFAPREDSVHQLDRASPVIPVKQVEGHERRRGRSRGPGSRSQSKRIRSRSSGRRLRTRSRRASRVFLIESL